MKRKLFTLVGVMATSLWSIANATIVTETYGFGSTANSGEGSVYTSTSGYSQTQGGQTIYVYGETASSGNLTAIATSGGTNGLFSVTNGSDGNTATGIGPYFSSEGGLPNLTNQNGITDDAGDQLLLINLSAFQGETVSFVMATGINAPKNSGIDVYEGTDASTPTGIGAGKSLPTEVITNYDINGNCTVGTNCDVTSGAISLPNLTGGTVLAANTWVAIEADCHYLLLDSLKATPSGVPEPSFYGFIALAMVGLVFGARKLRARAAAAEQA